MTPGKRIVQFSPPNRSKGRRGSGGQRQGRGGSRYNKGDQKARIEVPRYPAPKYVTELFDADLQYSPPGHRFLLYFHGASYEVALAGVRQEANKKKRAIENKMGEGKWQQLYQQYPPDNWTSLKNRKLYALKSVAPMGKTAIEIGTGLQARQAALFQVLPDEVLRVFVRLTSPLTTGLGNPHPVENGFSFLSPYGVPYLPGSGIKGVVRRAAEELALFSEESQWSIPLVWILFGFDGSSVYLAPPSSLKQNIDVLMEEAMRWRDAYSRYADAKEDRDRDVLKQWLSINEVYNSFPKRYRHLLETPSTFCRTLQEEKGNDTLRQAIRWQGLLRFWDIFFDFSEKDPQKASLSIDILNPHHKKYYENGEKDSQTTPNDAEAPSPVFFLTVPAGTECTLYCQMAQWSKALPSLENWKELVQEACLHAFDWLGFGAKTSVGYGAAKLDHGRKMRLEKQEKQKREDAALEEKRARLEAEREAQKRKEEAVLRAKEAALAAQWDAMSEEERDLACIRQEEVALKYASGDAKDPIPNIWPKVNDESTPPEHQKALAQAFKERWQAENKWKVKSKKKKQWEKVKRVKTILGEG